MRVMYSSMQCVCGVQKPILLNMIVQYRHVIPNRVQILPITGVLLCVTMVTGCRGYSCRGHTHLIGEVEEVGISSCCGIHGGQRSEDEGGAFLRLPQFTLGVLVSVEALPRPLLFTGGHTQEGDRRETKHVVTGLVAVRHAHRVHRSMGGEGGEGEGVR